MWKKEDDAPGPHGGGQRPTPSQSRPETPSTPAHRPAPTGGERATIGRSITIKGELTGDEDLLVQGRVEGTVDLKKHSVTIGPEGRVKAGVSGRVVTVEGEVEGDISASEQAILRSSARVRGDITSPRVVLEDGATFRGGIDMSSSADSGGRGPKPPAPKSDTKGEEEAAPAGSGAGSS